MIVDTSAIMAVLLGEPEAEAFMAAMTDATKCLISAGTWIELTAATVRKGHELQTEIQRLVSVVDAAIVPVSVEQALLGAAAYRTYGRGARHRARLNLGDCFAYALAKESGEPLLFKGNDFAQTDVTKAWEA